MLKNQGQESFGLVSQDHIQPVNTSALSASPSLTHKNNWDINIWSDIQRKATKTGVHMSTMNRKTCHLWSLPSHCQLFHVVSEKEVPLIHRHWSITTAHVFINVRIDIIIKPFIPIQRLSLS
jgi:hypothetical protein